MELMHGMRLANRFKVVGSLGGGDIGPLFLAADHNRNDSIVALKVVRKALSDDLRQHVKDAVMTQSTIESEHVMKPYEYVESEDFEGFASEYVQGQDLMSVIESETTDVDEAVRIVQEICTGLEELHRRGMLHGEIIPSKILLTEERKVILTDVGLPGVEHGEGGPRRNFPKGNAQYFAPEVLAGEVASVQSDIYSTGMILRALVKGDSASVAIPKGLARVISEAIATDTSRRFHSIREMQRALDRFSARYRRRGTLFLLAMALYVPSLVLILQAIVSGK